MSVLPCSAFGFFHTRTNDISHLRCHSRGFMPTLVKYSRDADTVAVKYIHFLLLAGRSAPAAGALPARTAVRAAAAAHGGDVAPQSNCTKAAHRVQGLAGVRALMGKPGPLSQPGARRPPARAVPRGSAPPAPARSPAPQPEPAAPLPRDGALSSAAEREPEEPVSPPRLSRGHPMTWSASRHLLRGPPPPPSRVSAAWGAPQSTGELHPPALSDGSTQPGAHCGTQQQNGDTLAEVGSQAPIRAPAPRLFAAPQTAVTPAWEQRKVRSCCGFISAPAFLFIPIVLAAGPVNHNKTPFKK